MRGSVRSRLLVAQLTSILLTLLVLGAGLTFALDRFYTQRLEAQLTAEATLAAELLQDALPAGAATVVGRLSPGWRQRLTVIGADGTVYMDAAADPSRAEPHGSDRPEIAAALQGRRGVAIRHSPDLGQDMLYVAVPAQQSGRVVGVVRMALPLSEVTAVKWQLAGTFAAMGLVAALVTVPYGVSHARRITEPLEAMTDTAQQLAEGDLSQRVEPAGARELAQLGRSLNRMASALEEKLAELAANRDRLDAVLASIPSGVIFVEGDGRITYANTAANNLLVPDLGAGGGHHVAVLRHYLLSAAIDRVMTSGQGEALELSLQRGRPSVAAVILAPLRRAPGGVVAVLRDVTQERRVEQMRRDFVANVSHELKTPVTAVRGFAETLLAGALSDPEDARQFVQIIHAESGRMAELIGDLLELARLEAEPDAVQPAPVPLEQLLEAPLVRLRPRVQQAGLEFHVDLPPGLVVSADASRIDQVLVNLVSNSIQYTAPGGSITVAARRLGRQVRVDVTDTGRGIPQSALIRIFERFYRVDRGRARKAGGTGLGLAIVKHIVEAHGGEVGAESEVGRGTTIWFTLPLV